MITEILPSEGCVYRSADRYIEGHQREESKIATRGKHTNTTADKEKESPEWTRHLHAVGGPSVGFKNASSSSDYL